jgi:hypothetical protein
MLRQESFGSLQLFDAEPIFVVTFHEGWTPRDFVGTYERIFSSAAPRVGIISDARNVRPADALKRKELGRTLQDLGTRRIERILASIVITDSSIMRGVIRAVLWLVPQPYPIIPVASMGAACDELLPRFAREGIPVPAPLVADVRALRQRSAA